MVTPRPTRTILFVDRTSIVSGDTVHGRAEVDVTLRGIGPRWIDAVFEDQGLWLGSRSDVNAVEVVKNTRRRAVHR